MAKYRVKHDSKDGSDDFEFVHKHNGVRIVKEPSKVDTKLESEDEDDFTLNSNLTPSSELTESDAMDHSDEEEGFIPQVHDVKGHDNKVVHESFKELINMNKRIAKPLTPSPSVKINDSKFNAEKNSSFKDLNYDYEDEGFQQDQFINDNIDTPILSENTPNNDKLGKQVSVNMNVTDETSAAMLNNINNTVPLNKNNMSMQHSVDNGFHKSLTNNPASSIQSVDAPGDGYSSLEEERVDLLFKLDRLHKKNFKIRSFDDRSNIQDIRKEYNRIKNELELEHSIGFSRKILMAVVSTIEYLNKRYDPFDLALGGWSESVMENINSYDNVLERLYYKYKNRVAMPPELELLITLAGSAFMFHMTNSLFKAAMSKSAGGNPDLLQSMMSAFANMAAQQPPPQQPPPPQQQQQPPPHHQRQPQQQNGIASRTGSTPMQQQVVNAGHNTSSHHDVNYSQQQSAYAQQNQFGPTQNGASALLTQPNTSDDHRPGNHEVFSQNMGNKQPYTMKGPPLDVTSILGSKAPTAVTNILPGLMGMLTGGGPLVGHLTNAPVMNNPIPSNAINVPKRPIEVEDERFNKPLGIVSNANAPLNMQVFQTTANKQEVTYMQNTSPLPAHVSPHGDMAHMKFNHEFNNNQFFKKHNEVEQNQLPIQIMKPNIVVRNEEKPFLPEPPPLRKTLIMEEESVEDAILPKNNHTPALDEDRLSDIITDDLETVKTDNLNTVQSDDEKMSIRSVSLTPSAGRSSVATAAKRSRKKASNGKVLVI